MIVEADTVVCALGFRSPYDKVDELADLVEEYYVIGDCKKVGKIYDAMNTGYLFCITCIRFREYIKE